MSHRPRNYARRARQRFCAGAYRKTPAELVLDGQRTLEEWVEVLNQERDRRKRPAGRFEMPEESQAREKQ